MVLHKHILIKATEAEPWLLFPQRLFRFHSFNEKAAQIHFVPSWLSQNKNTPLHKSMFSRTRKFQPFPSPLFPEMGRLGSKCSNPWQPAIPRHGNLWFQHWEAWVPTFSNPQFLQMETLASKVGKHGFQPFGNQYFLEIGTRGSNIRKHGPQPSGARVPRTRNPCFQRLGTRSSLKWEPVVPKLGSVGSQPGELRVPKS